MDASHAMARMFRAICSYLIILLIFQPGLVFQVEGQGNSTFVEQSEFTTFELFKNTGLEPCPINYTAAAVDTLIPRDPRRGGGGGGGTSTRGGGTTNELFASTWVGKQKQDYCKYMTGIPIMIPTVPTQNAFTPWWPTFTMQFVSLLFTWIGLWWTTRSVERNPEAHDMSLPITFWIQLPIDLARIVAWFFRTVHGFVDVQQFSWVSVILWLVPFNYIWLTRLLGSRTEDDTRNFQQDAMQTNLREPFVEQGYPQYQGYQVPVPETKQVVSQNISVYSLPQKRSKFYWVSISFVILTGIQWLMSLVVVVLHIRYFWMKPKDHPTYLEAPLASSNSSLIADMPQSCLNWLQQSSGLIASELLDMQLVQTVFCLINAIQFIACTAVLVFSSRSRFRILGKLKLSASASLASLGVPALATGIWIISTVVFGDQDTWITHTQNLTTTGGCTFAAVTMNRQWGYWDVEYSRPIRISMSVLGVA